MLQLLPGRRCRRWRRLGWGRDCCVLPLASRRRAAAVTGLGGLLPRWWWLLLLLEAGAVSWYGVWLSLCCSLLQQLLLALTCCLACLVRCGAALASGRIAAGVDVLLSLLQRLPTQAGATDGAARRRHSVVNRRASLLAGSRMRLLLHTAGRQLRWCAARRLAAARLPEIVIIAAAAEVVHLAQRVAPGRLALRRRLLGRPLLLRRLLLPPPLRLLRRRWLLLLRICSGIRQPGRPASVAG